MIVSEERAKSRIRECLAVRRGEVDGAAIMNKCPVASERSLRDGEVGDQEGLTFAPGRPYKRKKKEYQGESQEK